MFFYTLPPVEGATKRTIKNKEENIKLITATKQ
jgi:hypothetical protein